MIHGDVHPRNVLVAPTGDGAAPGGVTLVDAAGTDHVLTIEAIWHGDAPPTVERVVDAATRLAREGSWL